MACIRKIITINGAANTGKTTVSQRLTQIRPMTVSIELDSRCVGRITRHLPQSTKDYVLQKYGNTILDDCATLAINWIDRECDVIFPGPIWRDGFKDFKRLIDTKLGERQVEYHCFNLKPPLEVALQNRGTRILTEAEKQEINKAYDWLYEPSYGIIIDNQNQTSEQTTALIAAYLRDGTSKLNCIPHAFSPNPFVIP